MSTLTKAQRAFTDTLSDGLFVEDPYHLLTLFDPGVISGGVTLDTWQIEALMQFSKTLANGVVNRMAICAANGSGKTSFILAPCALWIPMRFKRGRSVVTSSSGQQMDRQSARNIKMLCESVNRTFREQFGVDGDVWKINEREFTYLPTGGIIECYATDEPGKAEGYHPLTPGGEFAIFVDEAKSIPEEIYQAITRCNGLTRRLDISSPGKPSGHFYNVFSGGRWWAKRITYKDCLAHTNLDEVEEAKTAYGEHSPAFRSMYLAEFTSTDEQVVVSYEKVRSLLQRSSQGLIAEHALTQESVSQGGLFAGLDLAAGGDENVLSVFKGNKQVGLHSFRYDDTTRAVDHIIGLFGEYGLKAENVNADDGGVGKAMIDLLWRKGYHVNRVLNQSRAINNLVYGNRGAEMWFNFARYVEENCVILRDDVTLKKQLASRYYKQPISGKIMLESKVDARAKGHGSPDRADATVLAWAYKPFAAIYDLMNGEKPEIVISQRAPLSSQQIIEIFDAQRDATFNVQNGGGKAAARFHSYQALIESQQAEDVPIEETMTVSASANEPLFSFYR